MQNQPALCVFKLSKSLEYDFHCNYINKEHGNKAELFTDTGSLAYSIKTNLVHEFFCKDKGMFYLSNFPKNSKIYDERSEMIIGKMKDVHKGFPIVEYVELKTKT